MTADAPTAQARERDAPRARFHDLDALRAFAILVVILFHVGMVARGFADAAVEPYKSGLRWLTAVAHDFQMPVFFVMSGFFGALVVERSGASEFARGRLVRIGVPLLAGWLVMGPVLNALTLWGENLRGGDPPPVDAGVLFTQDLHHLWFLWYLLMYCAVVLAVRAALARAQGAAGRGRGAFAALVASPWLVLAVLVPLTAIVLWPASLWTAAVPPEITPHAEPFAYHLLFFAFGWLLHA
ncbi:MAG: acyltransferase family protein, partial [Actinomycetota bacterium]|nr:acyltransferase family protein [Actinomycetota bacterium]